ncbi:MAG: DUF4445 domain-containing protein, partial [Candidatus Hydrogenedentes bacterium]|nr:DUF4445 domain-containing protein [Candidatus Hydrogenedentota bacterium]
MIKRAITVRFAPGGHALRVSAGVTAREAAAQAGLPIDSPCGGQGSCGKCRVRVLGDAGPLTAAEYTLLKDMDIAAGYRLACQIRLHQPLYIEIPEDSLQRVSYQILMHGAAVSGSAKEPSVRVCAVALPEPTLMDDTADLERLQRLTGPVKVDLGLLRELPGALRAGDFRGTAIIADGHLLDVVQGTKEHILSAAFDIGTTTLVGALLDARTGEVLCRASEINPQIHYGDDVLARITYATGGTVHLQRLRDEVVEAVNALAVGLCSTCGATVEDVVEITFSGNPTMQHLLLGIDPTPIGLSPFVPATHHGYAGPAAEAGIHLHPRARMYVMPSIGGYVGGDTVAGLLATSLEEATVPTLFIDIGTNGEMVLCAGGRLLATSCAAGPAFEGARIGQGMRAAAGAIEAVSFHDDVKYKTIGNEIPMGICGSALIDVAAELLRLGLITPGGTLVDASLVPQGTPPKIAARLRQGERGTVFVIAEAEDTRTGRPIALSQRDVRELQLATAAIRSGIVTLVQRTGLALEEVEHVMVAGAFGNFIRCENAQRIGLLPSEIPADRFEFVGNTSLAGACMAAWDLEQRHRAERLARSAEHTDLSLDPEFQEVFVSCLTFP